MYRQIFRYHHLGNGHPDFSGKPDCEPYIFFEQNHLPIERRSIEPEVRLPLSPIIEPLTSLSIKDGPVMPMKFMGNTMQPANHGAKRINEAALRPV